MEKDDLKDDYMPTKRKLRKIESEELFDKEESINQINKIKNFQTEVKKVKEGEPREKTDLKKFPKIQKLLQKNQEDTGLIEN
jgi:hypothetical protein